MKFHPSWPCLEGAWVSAQLTGSAPESRSRRSGVPPTCCPKSWRCWVDSCTQISFSWWPPPLVPATACNWYLSTPPWGLYTSAFTWGWSQALSSFWTELTPCCRWMMQSSSSSLVVKMVAVLMFTLADRSCSFTVNIFALCKQFWRKQKKFGSLFTSFGSLFTSFGSPFCSKLGPP